MADLYRNASVLGGPQLRRHFSTEKTAIITEHLLSLSATWTIVPRFVSHARDLGFSPWLEECTCRWCDHCSCTATSGGPLLEYSSMVSIRHHKLHVHTCTSYMTTVYIHHTWLLCQPSTPIHFYYVKFRSTLQANWWVNRNRRTLPCSMQFPSLQGLRGVDLGPIFLEKLHKNRCAGFNGFISFWTSVHVLSPTTYETTRAWWLTSGTALSYRDTRVVRSLVSVWSGV